MREANAQIKRNIAAHDKVAGVYVDHSLIYSSHINSHIFDKVKEGSKVLDIGCNAGSLGKKLIEEKGCIVYGVDISESAVLEAKKNINFAVVGDLENREIPFSDRDFDVIILADILEHLKDPGELLVYVKTFLKDSGSIIISIPNVAHIKVRLGLLFGNWNYAEHGILDKTHLRFFTQKTSIALVKSAGLKIESIDCNTGLRSVLGGMEKYVSKIFPRLSAVQFIITATK